MAASDGDAQAPNDNRPAALAVVRPKSAGLGVQRAARQDVAIAEEPRELPDRQSKDFQAGQLVGGVGDALGRRWATIIPSAIAIPLACSPPTSPGSRSVLSSGVRPAGPYRQLPSYLSERFPTEVRVTASAFCYHQGAIFGGFVPLVLTYLP